MFKLHRSPWTILAIFAALLLTPGCGSTASAPNRLDGGGISDGPAGGQDILLARDAIAEESRDRGPTGTDTGSTFDTGASAEAGGPQDIATRDVAPPRDSADGPDASRVPDSGPDANGVPDSGPDANGVPDSGPQPTDASTPPFLTDPAGWTVFPRTGTVYYVSSSLGNDNNAGTSESAPVRTIAKGFTLIAGGDWLLLRRGDVFQGGISNWRNGQSSGARTIFGAYGDESQPRPRLEITTGSCFTLTGGGGRPATVEHVAFVSLHCLAVGNDPTRPGWTTPTASSGVALLRPGQDLFFEDMRFDLFTVGMVLQAEGAGVRDSVVRRSVVVDSYQPDSSGHSQGMFASNMHGLLLEENVFDHNGWHPTVAGAYPTMFNHNFYIQSDCSAVVLRNNVIARGSSHGFQLRPSGHAEGNVLIGNGIAGFVSNDAAGLAGAVQIIRNNVVLHGGIHALGEGGRDGTRGWGLALIGGGTAIAGIPDFSGNIVAHAERPAHQAYDVESRYSGIARVANNITYAWGGDNSSPGPFVDPARTIASYHASIGQAASINAFLAGAREQRRGRWFGEYTAPQVRAYFVQGFSPR